VSVSDAERFQNMVRRGAPLSYATRCRLVADEVRHQHEEVRSAGACAWLDEQMAPLPVDDEERRWLAQSSQVDPAALEALSGGP
jgi:hypothetical protein